MQRFHLACYLAVLILLTGATSLGYHYYESDWVYFRRAEIEFQKLNFSEAIPLYRKSLDLGFKKPTALLHLADSLLATKDFGAALTTLETVHQKYPKERNSTIKLAHMYHLFKQPEKAIALYKEDSNNLYTDSAAAMHLAELYKGQNKIRLAEIIYRKVIERDAGNYAALRGLAETVAWDKRYKEALRIYRALLKQQPQDSAVRFQYAQVLSWDKQYEAALAQYKILLQLNPEDEQLRRHYARTLAWAGENSSALKELKKK